MPAPLGRLVTHLTSERQASLKAEHAMRRRVIAAIAWVCVAIAIGAFAFWVSRPAPPNPTPAQPAASAPATAPSISARGNIPKRLGERAGFGPSNAPAQNTFAINRITIDPSCTSGGTQPKTAHTVLLDVTVSTGSDEERAAQLGRILTSGFFSVIGPDGTEHDAWPGECTDPGRGLPEMFGADMQYSGTIELRVAEATGQLVLAGNMENAAGWEWEIP